MENLMPYRIKWELSKWLIKSLKLEAQEIDRFESRAEKLKRKKKKRKTKENKQSKNQVRRKILDNILYSKTDESHKQESNSYMEMLAHCQQGKISLPICLHILMPYITLVFMVKQ